MHAIGQLKRGHGPYVQKIEQEHDYALRCCNCGQWYTTGGRKINEDEVEVQR